LLSLIEVALDLGPTIKAMRDEIERERRLPAGGESAYAPALGFKAN
jgi:hypothetical protein